MLLGADHIVADDLRFPNEAELITALGGELLELRRADVEDIHQSTHRSDGGLTGYNFDKTIHNNGSVEHLCPARPPYLSPVEPTLSCVWL